MDEFIKWFGFIGTAFGIIIGIVGTYFSWNAWSESKKTQQLFEKERARLNEKIKIILTDGKNEHLLPVLRRQDVTRSEIQGRLGVVPRKTELPYKIAYLNDEKFFKQIDEITEGSNSSGKSDLTVNCTDEEFAQFNFDLPKIETKKRIKKVKENNGK